MQRLEALGEYFSDEEMKQRDPLLYEEMIGKYLTDDDVKAMVAPNADAKDHALSDVLMKHIQVMQNNELYERLKDAEVFNKKSALAVTCCCCLPGLVIFSVTVLIQVAS